MLAYYKIKIGIRQGGDREDWITLCREDLFGGIDKIWWLRNVYVTLRYERLFEL